MELPPTASLAPLMLLAALFALTVWRGLRDGMHRRLAAGKVLQFQIEAFAVAISDLFYGGGRSATGLRVVLDFLQTHGLQRFMHNGSPMVEDTARIDAVLQAATRLPWDQVLASPRFLINWDKGLVDFIHLAFQLFGVRLAAPFALFHLLLGLSLSAFALAFLALPAALWAGCVLLAGYLLFTYESPFLSDREVISNVTDYRYIEMLAVLPALHLFLGQTALMPPTALQVAMVVGQAVLLWFVATVRASTKWAVLGLPAAAGCAVLGQLWSGGWPGALALLRGGVWILPLALAILIGLDLWRRQRLHPAYFGEDGALSHATWMAAYNGFALDGETWQRAKLPGQYDRPDDCNAYMAVHDHFLRHPETRPPIPYPHIDWTFNGPYQDLKWPLFDRVIRTIAQTYLREHRASMPRLYAVIKPRRFYAECWKIIGPLLHRLRRPTTPGLAVPLVVGIGASLGLVLAGGGGLSVAVAALLLLGTSPAPLIWAYPMPETVGVQSWILLFAPLLLAAGLLGAVVS